MWARDVVQFKVKQFGLGECRGRTGPFFIECYISQVDFFLTITLWDRDCDRGGWRSPIQIPRIEIECE